MNILSIAGSMVLVGIGLAQIQGCAVKRAVPDIVGEKSLESVPAGGGIPHFRTMVDISSTWKHFHLPGKKVTEYGTIWHEGRNATVAHANASASMLRQTVRISPEDLGKMKFSWKVPELIAKADMALRDADDSPVRIVLAFDGDRASFSTKNAMLSELAHALTGEPLPYATLMYVWCNKREPGAVVFNPRTDRIRQLVMESGSQNLGQWMDYERDIRADFEKAFGEAPGVLLSIGIMTDSDNTQSTTQAWYGPVKLTQ